MGDEILIQDVLAAKRDGETLETAAIEALVAGLVDGRVSDAQAGAFAMAVCTRGMSDTECIALTDAMTRSGDRLDWPDLDGPVIDKHSTGGVGDKVSLVLAPIVAACGLYVPMISGRGLGHTGGTLDKLESLPGYDVSPSRKVFQRVVQDTGLAIVGQTAELAPADGRLYAVRDNTATVESIPLIVASILSKKLAAGLDALVMDVKVGSGAFMPTAERARELAKTLVAVGQGAGTPVHALITDMDSVLGYSVGNALEVLECLDFLSGERRDARLEAIVMALATEMLVLGGVATDMNSAYRRAKEALADGRAAERFAAMVAALGGPNTLYDGAGAGLATAPIVQAVVAEADGCVAAMDTREIGMIVLRLGGGRREAGERIDPAVGLTDVLPIGTAVSRGDRLLSVHAGSEEAARRAVAALGRAVHVAADSPASRPPILDRVTA